MAGYYYGQLSKEKKAVYDMLAAGARQSESKLSLHSLA